MVRRARNLFALLWFAIAFAVAGTAMDARSLSIIRDPDIEHALARLARPLIEAAGLNPARVRIVVLNDDRMNAFVADDRHIFLNSGMILRMDRAAEVQAVIAHELAHIANGHLTSRAGAFRSANTASGLAIGLAIAAAAAGADATAAGTVAIGATGAANRNALAHSRAEEASADASALRYLSTSGIDPGAMADVLLRFRGQEALIPSQQDPYIRSHPLTRDRIRNAEGYAAAKGGATKDTGEDDYWFARAQGKLSAFLRNPKWTLRRVNANDRSDVALMRRAVAYHLQSDQARALQNIDALAAKRPNDPFVHDLRGQILLESRNFDAAIAAYRRAANLSPKNALILASYGRALLTRDTRSATAEALKVLTASRDRDNANPRMLRDLAVAYARSGQNGMASLVTAERYAMTGQFQDAAVHANRASGLLPQGSPGWRRAEDILRIAQQTESRRRG